MNEVLRQEKKYLISLEQMYYWAHSLSQVLHEDEHNRGAGYPIRSLYFDTLDDDDFEDKEDGIELRRKIRLRNYGADTPFAVLEMKQKQGSLQKKRSLRMTREDAAKLIDRDFSVLLRYDEPFARECFALMQTQLYLPRSVIEYCRRAFVAPENKIRITFDHHIVGTESRYDIFSPHLLQSYLLNPYLVVLEVKYNGFLPSYIKDMLWQINKSELSVSKYCLGRSISRHFCF